MKNLFIFTLLLLSLTTNAGEVAAPPVLTPQMLDAYVNQINSQSPIRNSDGITIVGASKQDKTIIYRVKTSFETTSEAATFLNSLKSAKTMLCRQEAEGFFLVEE